MVQPDQVNEEVAGTLKLDQAQFRELKPSPKFGSDLDASTKLTIERGRRNTEVLKQPQYQPVPVESRWLSLTTLLPVVIWIRYRLTSEGFRRTSSN